ncbi:putative bifunctional diguanylate cyclase/phosphodiesterase [Phaeobacter inhibens]|uniref:putative bifunctional diguanylate cyclase/phosphodiesterase n=1 Tax=Phaeobacter inhibens TaxID=221822 RepID=UPI0021A71C33|nr:bifunctional diguanylate cyclase/phosphodiesterase [Phaeobacter inhibens]UWR88743.1 bifunctional diguanylate cyclase/phosphodiesterase [Phaeobacter inhibens]
MTKTLSQTLTQVRKRIAPVLLGPPLLAFLPAMTLATFWLAGEAALLAVALGLPLIFAASGGFAYFRRPTMPRDSLTGMMMRDGFKEIVSEVYDSAADTGLRSAVFIVELDDFKELAQRHGQETADQLVNRCGDRIISILRPQDYVARIGDSRFAICLTPVLQMDLELAIQMAGRLQASIEEPIAVDGASLYVSCSIGFCLHSRTPRPSGNDWMSAACTALLDAQNNGPSGIRAFSPEMDQRSKARGDMLDEVTEALENGQIQAWFQPQICTDTGRVSGFEALARWAHPVRGMIAPMSFLPTLESAGLMERLSEIMLYNALTALKAWDAAGLNVPSVGVNFATDELRNANLVERISWELERFGLTPDRLSIEILETVMTDRPDDMIVRNIAALGELGCGIDLDDFGTGHASIAAVQRFRVSRIKIDRSFVMKADRDPEQQKLIAAILTMAERLDLATLAEGVETVGEHALLSQLGCDHVQGFGIGRPMPFDQTLDWIAAHEAKLQEAPTIGRQGN